MARDIYMFFDVEEDEADLVVEEGDLKREEGLATAVLMSLYTDRRAEESDDYDNEDKKGWWGDQLSQYDDDKIGSRLYLLHRAKATQDNINKAKEYIYEALEWLIIDGVAASIDIDVWSFGDVYNKRLGALIKINRKEGNTIAMKFDDLWEKTYTLGVA